MGNRKTVWLLSLAIVTILILPLMFAEKNDTYSIHDGTLDLSKWDKSGAIQLNGEVDFYWNRLITKSELSEGSQPDVEAVIPSVWNYYKINGKRLPGFGYGTYRIHVVGADTKQTLSLRLQPLSTAYEVYIDDKLLTSCGEVGTTEADSVPKYVIKSESFIPPASSFDIIIQVSNFSYARGGAWFVPYLGTDAQITKLDTNIRDLDIFFVIFYIVMIIYNLIFYLFRKERNIIVFVVLCILVLARTLTSGSYLLNELLPGANYYNFIYIMYITMYIMPTVWLLFAYRCFPIKIPKRILQIGVGYSAAATLLSFAVPIRVMTALIYPIEAVIILTCLIVLSKCIGVIVENLQEKPLDMYLVLFGCIAILFCSVRDILYNNNYIKGGFMEATPFGIMILTLTWNLSFMYRYEVMMRDRLRVLKELNEASERERVLELKYLKSQIRPHFIHNALNTIISISRTDSEKSNELLYEFSNYLRNCYDMGRPGDVTPLENELSLVRSYVALEQARYRESLCIEYKIDEITTRVPPLILQPLVENAITHNKISGKKPLHVTVYALKNGDYDKIGVLDDGEGFELETIPALLTHDKSSQGVGIYNINQRLIKIYGTTLQINNVEGGGADVFMLIPDNKGGDEDEGGSDR